MRLSLKSAGRTAIGRSRAVALSLVLGAAVLTACGNDATGASDTTTPPAAVAGWLSVNMVTPHTDDGAVQLYLVGPTTIDSLSAVGYQGYTSSDESGAQLIATGSLLSGVVGRFWVKDVSLASQYHVAVVAAAARDTYALQDLQGYTVSVVH